MPSQLTNTSQPTNTPLPDKNNLITLHSLTETGNVYRLIFRCDKTLRSAYCPQKEAAIKIANLMADQGIKVAVYDVSNGLMSRISYSCQPV